MKNANYFIASITAALCSGLVGLVVMVYSSFYYDNHGPSEIMPLTQIQVAQIVALAVFAIALVAAVNTIVILKLFKKFAPRKYLNHVLSLIYGLIVMVGGLIQSYHFFIQRF